MKKVVALLLCLMMLAVGCSSREVQNPEINNDNSASAKSNDMNTIKKYGNEEIFKLYEIDIDAIEAVLTNYTWAEGTGDCLCEYEMTIEKVQYMYHADCGTFNDSGFHLCLIIQKQHSSCGRVNPYLMNSAGCFHLLFHPGSRIRIR